MSESTFVANGPKDESHHPIERADLQKRLQRAASGRAILTAGVWVATFPLLGLALEALPPFGRGAEAIGAVALFGIALLEAWLVDRVWSRGRVPCPRCGGSLWSCGTGNFKPRRIRIREGVAACPHCWTAIV